MSFPDVTPFQRLNTLQTELNTIITKPGERDEKIKSIRFKVLGEYEDSVVTVEKKAWWEKFIPKFLRFDLSSEEYNIGRATGIISNLYDKCPNSGENSKEDLDNLKKVMLDIANRALTIYSNKRDDKVKSYFSFLHEGSIQKLNRTIVGLEYFIESMKPDSEDDRKVSFKYKPEGPTPEGYRKKVPVKSVLKKTVEERYGFAKRGSDGVLRVDWNLMNIPDKDGITPFQLALANEDLKTIRKFVENGAELNPITEFKNSPLAIAVKRGDLELFTYLVKNGTNVFKDDQKLLSLAEQQGQHEIFTYVLSLQNKKQN